MAPHHEPPSALFALTVNCPHFYRAFLFSIRRAAHARGMMLSLFVSVIAAAAPPPVGVTRADELAAEAETAWTSGQFETALAGFRKSLALRRPESPGYSGILGSIAELERTLGHLREAERDARRALELRRRGFGPDNPDVAAAENNVAEVLRSGRRYRAAEELYRRALATLDRAGARELAQRAGILSNLGQVLTAQRKKADAEEVLRNAVELFAAAGERGMPRAIALNNLAVLLGNRGRYEEAAGLLREVLAVSSAALPAGHLHTALVRANLADTLRLLKRYAEAETEFAAALRAIEMSVGPDHPERATALAMYSLLLRDTGRSKEARRTLAESREIRQRHARTDGWTMVVSARPL
jgi:tetratricopeptide (TPR) repeat protein